MRPARVHSWNISPDEATAIQNNLREKVVVSPINKDIHHIGGTAVTFNTTNNTIHAALSVLSYPDMTLVEQRGVSQEIRFDYISGLLAFREGAPLMSLFRKTDQDMDVVLFHSHGQAHPRKFGLASHLGVLLDVPSIGVSNKILVGHHEHLSEEQYSESHIVYDNERIGAALRSKENTKPIYISVGHKADLSSSTELIKKLVKKYRLPEPIRLSQLAADQQKEGRQVDMKKKRGQTSLF